MYRYSKLSKVRQTQLIAGLMLEMKSARFNHANQIVNSSIVIDFGTMKAQVFWWFYDTVIEVFVQELGQLAESKASQMFKEI